MAELLVANCHVHENNQSEVLISGTRLERNDVHDTMRFLQQDESSFIVLHRLVSSLAFALYIPESVLYEL